MTDVARAEVQGVGRFVGREAELQALLIGLAQARSGRGGLFLIGGEPGIGKSRLADEFAEHARQSGADVLWGRAWEGAGAPAYWPWIQALRGHLRKVDSTDARAQLGPGAADIVQLLPEISDLVPNLAAPPPESDSARFRLFDSTASFLRRVAAQRVTVLVLDDLHAADAPSILLLRFLAGNLQDMQLVAVGTYRDVALGRDQPLTAALPELIREPSSRQLTLSGLPEDLMGPLIEATTGVRPSSRLPRSVWRETGGNPLFVGESLRLLAAEGGLERLVGHGPFQLSVPAGIRDVIARRVHRLSAETVEALTHAAVLGPEFGVETLRRVGRYGTADFGDRLSEALEAGLVVPVAGAIGRYRFSHDLVRESLYQEQLPVQRARLHRRVAEVLEEFHAGALDAHLPELAHHYFEAVQGGGLGEADELEAMAGKALRYAIDAAGQAVRSLAYEEAARHYRMALAVLDLENSHDERQRTELLLAVGDAEGRAGDMESAGDAFMQAAAVARRTGEATDLARAALGIGGRMIWGRPGRNRHLVPLLREALAMLGEGSDELLRVRLLARLACALRSDADMHEQSDLLSRQAVDLARQLGDPESLSYALVCRAWATWWPDNLELRAELAREMAEVASAVGDSERMIDAHMMLYLSHSEDGRMAEVARETTLAAQLADDLHQPSQVWLSTGWRALTMLLEGRFDEAAAIIERELASGPAVMSNRDNVSAGTFHQFLLYREKGLLERAEANVRAAVEEFAWYPLHRAALVLLLIETGRPSEAHKLFAKLTEGGFEVFQKDNEWLLGMSLASEACALLHNGAAAQVLYGRLRPYAGRHAIGQLEGSVGAVDRYLGLLAATLGRLDEAEEHLADAVGINERMGARPWTAHSEADLALVLRRRGRRGDDERAVALEQAALETADELGMTVLGARLRLEGAEAAHVARSPEPGALLRREGEYWTIAFGGDAFRLRDAKGLRYMARLLAEPGREILALELAKEGPPAAGRSASTAAPDLHLGSLGDAGALLDGQAKQAYRQRLHELHTELDEAEAWNDAERAERARGEMEFIAHELKRAMGLGGRDRTAASASERARLSVTRAIRNAVSRIGKHSKPLGQHLDATIHTGTYCAYRPDPRVAITWETSR
jgi:tetratricopeptide (TPR) repeat protein